MWTENVDRLIQQTQKSRAARNRNQRRHLQFLKKLLILELKKLNCNEKFTSTGKQLSARISDTIKFIDSVVPEVIV